MKIIIIAAVSKNGFIGKNNQLMWHLPNDLKRFKNMTIGEIVIMGRKTFESIGKILPKRKNIILTRNKTNFLYLKNKKNVNIISSIKEIENLTYKKIFIIGGEKTYAYTIEKAHSIELTLVHEKFYGDTKFPKIDPKKWEKTYEFFYKKDKNHLFNYSFIKFERKK
ncbi:Dihydrofolate reductase [Blattabacterium sp. (Nauphoeta cinerea)]|uniref:dihydrofolate reductase n=1 Tax=Blattabacterium sp. (Nauphoeta cinerea) TaxID=1316444 RepID=UPI0003B0810E|nr:dihydrofolate reductase [Blattabacterium sp. (Nauphoeta cinerea)]AGW86200.1 Dihydrofolate reductase [Blattabacterium sp. (Nauphoeta cinerea)]